MTMKSNDTQEIKTQEMKDGNSANQSENHSKDLVEIDINNIKVPIHRGNQTVATIKKTGNIPSTDILYKMPDYEIGLNDADTIVIKGGEQFKSSAPSGASS